MEGKLVVVHSVAGVLIGKCKENTHAILKLEKPLSVVPNQQGGLALGPVSIDLLPDEITVEKSNVVFSYVVKDSNLQKAYDETITQLQAKMSGITLASPQDLKNVSRNNSHLSLLKKE